MTGSEIARDVRDEAVEDRQDPRAPAIPANAPHNAKALGNVAWVEGSPCTRGRPAVQTDRAQARARNKVLRITMMVKIRAAPAMARATGLASVLPTGEPDGLREGRRAAH